MDWRISKGMLTESDKCLNEFCHTGLMKALMFYNVCLKRAIETHLILTICSLEVTVTQTASLTCLCEYTQRQFQYGKWQRKVQLCAQYKMGRDSGLSMCHTGSSMNFELTDSTVLQHIPNAAFLSCGLHGCQFDRGQPDILYEEA